MGQAGAGNTVAAGNTASIAITEGAHVIHVALVDDSGTVLATTQQPVTVLSETTSNIIYLADEDITVNTIAGELGASGSDIGQFNLPFGLAKDSAGKIFVADYSNNRIVTIDSDGTVAPFVDISQPYGIAIDNDDNVYAIHRSTRTIKKFNSAGIEQSYSTHAFTKTL